MVKFIAENHRYESIIYDNREWLGVTTLVHAFCEPFNKIEKAAKASVRVPSSRYPNKWYKVSPEDILQAWEKESKRATDLGHWYHNKKEKELLEDTTLTVFAPIVEDGVKLAPDQRLRDGVYPEHLVYLAGPAITGQSDIVKVEKGIVTIEDHKTSKEIKREGFTNWEGTKKKMLQPFTHLEDCQFNHYALQLSIYMYCILKHNPLLLPGKLRINHVKFVEAGKDKYDYPIAFLDENNEPVVESIEVIELPYLRGDVVKLIDYISDPKKRALIKKH
jgi:hypothetical protein